jgi:hypothetical protein
VPAKCYADYRKAELLEMPIMLVVTKRLKKRDHMVSARMLLGRNNDLAHQILGSRS